MDVVAISLKLMKHFVSGQPDFKKIRQHQPKMEKIKE
jgi:hypothetical protein